MPTARIILAPVTLVIAVACAAGCHPLEPSIAPGPTPFESGPITGGSPAEQWHAPPVAVQPVVPEQVVPQQVVPQQPGAIYLAPGDPVFVQPSVILPPAEALGPPPPTTNWWDILPAEGGAISPDFGLPRAPVVENRVPNPIVVPVSNAELAWDGLADVVTDYFPIQREQPVQQAGGFMTEGFIETPFQVGATIFEPQRNDSVGRFNRWQSTLQSIRRKAFINVQPTAGGYAIRVNVIKQLEDLPQPELALTSAAVLRNDNALPSGRSAPVVRTPASDGWIDLGRDEPLEQEMLRRIQERLANPVTPSATRSVF